jgi:hypothetical protein
MSADKKFEDLKNLLVGEELRRFDTKFMEFGDKLKEMASTAGADDVQKVREELDGKVAQMDEKINRLQRDVKAGFDKIIDTINAQFKRIDGSLDKNAKDVEAVRKKFDGFKQLFADK